MALPQASEQHNNDIGKPRFTRAYSFAIITGLFFLVSWVGQFVAQVFQIRNEAQQHGEQFAWADFWPDFLASTFENWQSEFLQLVWQAVGLAVLLYWGSSQSKESDERVEAKLDRLLEDRGIDPASVTEQVNSSL